MRVGVRASQVSFRRIDSVARTAAQVIREASSGGDPQALGRFLRSFSGYLEVPGSAPGPAPSSGAPPSRPPQGSPDRSQGGG
jgi:hypothetical protein